MAYNTLWSAWVFFLATTFKMLSGFPVTIQLAIIHRKTNHLALGKITPNLAVQEKEKQHYLHKTVCGARHPLRIIPCSVLAEFKWTSTDFGLSFYSFLPFPPGTQRCIFTAASSQLLLPPAVFPQTVRKQTGPTCRRLTRWQSRASSRILYLGTLLTGLFVNLNLCLSERKSLKVPGDSHEILMRDQNRVRVTEMPVFFFFVVFFCIKFNFGCDVGEFRRIHVKHWKSEAFLHLSYQAVNTMMK